MWRKLLMAFGVLAASVALASAESGVWTPASNFAQLNVACTRVYTCGPVGDVMRSADTRLVTTPPQTVWGVCAAGGGAIDSCNVCLTNPPDEPCEWHIEPR